MEKSPLNIVFYSNCQSIGIQFFLEKYFKSKNIDVCFIATENNYQIIKNDNPIPVDIISQADIFIYQPIDTKWGIYSTDTDMPDNIVSYLKKDCIKISFPYIYNSSLWSIITPSIGDGVTGGGLFKDVNKYINKECIEELKLNHKSLEEVIQMYNTGEINFNYEERLINNLLILKEKEKKCNIIVSDFIEKNIRTIELFLNQGHPTTPLFVHCANQIIHLLYGGELNTFSYDYPEQYFAGDYRLPHSKYDEQFWNFKYNVCIEDNLYIEHIKHIYNSCEYELNALCKYYSLDKTMYFDNNNQYLWGHNYINSYNILFDNLNKPDVKNILEIGLGFVLSNSSTAFSQDKKYRPGNSLRMWRDYFNNSNVFGIDINPELMFNEDRIQTFVADQSNETDLQNVINRINCELDIIIDDGSHYGEHQVYSFMFLNKFLKPNGIYIIEDVMPYNINKFIDLTIFPDSYINYIRDNFVIQHHDTRQMTTRNDDFIISFTRK